MSTWLVVTLSMLGGFCVGVGLAAILQMGSRDDDLHHRDGRGG